MQPDGAPGSDGTAEPQTPLPVELHAFLAQALHDFHRLRHEQVVSEVYGSILHSKAAVA